VAKLGSIELSCAIIDEASQVGEDVFGQIVGRLSQNLKIPDHFKELPPFYQDWVTKWVDTNPCLIATNPEAPSHWIYRTFLDEEHRNPAYKALTTNSINNPHLPTNYLRDNLIKQFLRRPKQHPNSQIDSWIKGVRDGSISLQEVASFLTTEGKRKVCGQWVSNDSAVFDFDPQDQEIAPNQAPEMTEDSHRFVGLDFGFHNPRIGVIQADLVDYNWHYTVLDYSSPKSLTGREFTQTLKKFCQDYAIETIFHPHDQPGVVAEINQLIPEVVTQRAKVNVSGGIAVVKAKLSQGRLKYVRRPTSAYQVFKNEMGGYSWKQDRHGVTLNEPVKKDDHYCDCIRYGVFTFELLNRREAPAEEELGDNNNLVFAEFGQGRKHRIHQRVR
jgi:phage terminase large subunit